MPLELSQLLNTATVTTTTYDPDLENNTSTIAVDVEIFADIEVIKTGPALITAGNRITYTITVTNKGPQAAENVVLTDAVPAVIASPMFTVDSGAEAPWTGSYNLGNMAANAVHTVTITGIVNYDAAPGLISNTATAVSQTPDPDEENNTSTIQTDIETEADIEIEKSASRGVVNPNDTLSYTLVITNHGPSKAVNVVVTDAIPSVLLNPQFTFDGTPAGSWTGTYVIGDMPPGEYHTIVIATTVSENADTTITNTAHAQSSTYDPDLTNNESTTNTDVDCVADVAVVKTPSKSVVNPGDSLDFTLLITNYGPSTAENVVVADTLPAGLLNPTFTVNGIPQGAWTGSYTIGNMPVGSVSIVITSTVDPAISFFL